MCYIGYYLIVQCGLKVTFIFKKSWTYAKPLSLCLSKRHFSALLQTYCLITKYNLIFSFRNISKISFMLK